MQQLARITALMLIAVSSAQAQDDPQNYTRPGENIARGKPYTMDPAPRYGLCTDADDKTQLTDGEHSTGYFWAQKTTVGWQGGSHFVVSIDLGQIEPIGGVSFHTAAGVAEVHWPRSIYLYVSDDGKSWWPSGEVLAKCNEQNGPPPEYGNYGTWRFWTDQLRLHGRYLAMLVKPEGGYSFVDEIEVYRGDAALLQLPRSGHSSPDLTAAVQSLWFRAEVEADLADVKAAVAAAKLSATARRDVGALVAKAEADLDQVDGVGADAPAIVPYGAPHREVFAVHAALLRALGRPELTVAAANRWDPLRTTDPPANRPAGIDVALMQGETRGAAFTLLSTATAERTLTIRGDGLGAAKPPWLRLKEVPWTATRSGRAVACALPDMRPTADGWSLTLVPGLPQQVWVEVEGEQGKPGLRQGSLALYDGVKRVGSVTLKLRVSKLVMPAENALLVSGWDYTDGGAYGINQANLERCIEFLRKYRVNATWATASVMPWGQHAGDGTMEEPQDTTRLDTWVERWKGAKLFCVFNAWGAAVPDTPAGRKGVADWINFYVKHLGEKGIQPSQLALLLVDEPSTPEQDQTIISWAKAIHAAQPEVRVFNDPIWQEPEKTTPELLANTNLMSPNRAFWLTKTEAHEGAYLPHRSAGNQMAFYSCSGPVRQLAPYSYHRLQAWECWRYGGVMSSFWAFSDNGGGSSWNEISTPTTVFAPQFLDQDGCTTSKHMEAIRESVFDFEYLTMLKQRLEGAAPGSAAFVAKAKDLLAHAAERVLAGEMADGIWWANDKDRSVAEPVRL
ncbi:MAG: hypothetical protein HYU66_12880, partial [Armatimonadetes bacterium]|nr:hypothetical protein [Armatimonadota bacterium]